MDNILGSLRTVLADLGSLRAGLRTVAGGLGADESKPVLVLKALVDKYKELLGAQRAPSALSGSQSTPLCGSTLFGTPLIRSPTGRPDSEVLWRCRAMAAEGRSHAMWALLQAADHALGSAASGAFKNGVTDETGTVDEGEALVGKVCSDIHTFLLNDTDAHQAAKPAHQPLHFVLGHGKVEIGVGKVDDTRRVVYLRHLGTAKAVGETLPVPEGGQVILRADDVVIECADASGVQVLIDLLYRLAPETRPTPQVA